ncbi:MAG: hypothetical protein ABIT76_04540 [Chthoniobacterales bacterium]
MKSSSLSRAIDTFQSLFFYGSSGLVAFGCYLNTEMGVSPSFYPLLWFAGGMFIYNLDRLIPDPADPINVPNRARFTHARKWLIRFSLAVLIVTPIYEKNWLLLGLIGVAAIVSAFYCIIPPGFSGRIKDAPLLKWVMPPIVVLATLTVPIWIKVDSWELLLKHWALLGGIFIALLTNILLFDQRDTMGDTSSGVRTLANWLEPKSFFRLLYIMMALQIAFLFVELHLEMVVFTIYLGVLVSLIGKKRRPEFYDWAVDGMFFVPMIVKWLEKLN